MFDYSVWEPGTSVILGNVPWDSTYRDIVQFSEGGVKEYLKSREYSSIEIKRLTYCPQGQPIRINLPFNVANKYNYVIATNAPQPVPDENGSSVFAYFISEVKYVAPNTTELVLQLDVWQTYQNSVKFSRGYVERGHLGMAIASHGYYKQKYLTVPEGLDLGNEYVYGSVIKKEIGNTSAISDNPIGIIILSTISLNGKYGDVDNPSFTTATGSNFEGLPNGCEIYYCSDTVILQRLLTKLSTVPWVAQGIISITAVPPIENINDYGKAWATEAGISHYDVNGDFRSLWKLSSDVLNDVKMIDFGNIVDNIKKSIPDRYKSLEKFYTFPYSFIELTTFSGTPLVIKPELLVRKTLKVSQLMHVAPPAPRVMFTVNGYGSTSEYPDDSFLGKPNSDYAQYRFDSEYLDMGTGITNLPQFSVTNNAYLSVIASQAHSLSYQHDSAQWSQNKALTSASNTANLAAASMNAATAQTGVQTSTATQQAQLQNSAAQSHTTLTQLNAGASALTGAATAAVTGNIAGAGMALGSGAASALTAQASTNIDNNLRNQSTALSNSAAMSSLGISNNLAANVRDTNLSYANYAANGDYANAIAGINARVQDAKLTQPTTSGQVGGDAFNLSVDGWNLLARFKHLNYGAMRIIGEFWLRYGYALNLPLDLPDNLNLMTKFTYWKLSETYLESGSCPELFRQTIRGIFEKGVTVWAKPEYIGNTDYADNEPKSYYVMK